MSDQTEKGQEIVNDMPVEKSGCMTFIGVLLLLAAVAAVVYFFIAKPALEEQGIDVNEKVETVKVRAGETISQVKDKLIDAGDVIAEKYSYAKEKIVEAANSESAEKIKETAGKVKNSEAVAGAAEKTSAAGKAAAEKLESGESWY